MIVTACYYKELQPKASQRAIADMVGVSNETIAKDLGMRETVNLLTNSPEDTPEEIPENVNKLTLSSPAIPPDDYDPHENAPEGWLMGVNLPTRALDQKKKACIRVCQAVSAILSMIRLIGYRTC